MTQDTNRDPAVQLLCEMFAAREVEAPEPTGLAERARMRARRSARARWSGPAAAAAVLLVAAGVATVVFRGGRDVVVTADPTTSTTYASGGPGSSASVPTPPPRAGRRGS